MLAGCWRFGLQRRSIATTSCSRNINNNRQILSSAVKELESSSDLTNSLDRYAALLKQCCHLRAIDEGRRIHAHISTKSPFHGHRFLGNLLLRMYAICNSVEEARAIFDAFFFKQPRNIYTWNGMLEAYARSGHIPQCVHLFQFSPEKNEVSWNITLQALTQKENLGDARAMLEKMPSWSAVALTVMLSAYAQKRQLEETKEMFERLAEKDTVACNTMIKAFLRNGDLKSAREVFESMEDKTVVSWTTMIGGYAEQGYVDEARQMFDGLVNPDNVAWTTMIQAYSKAGRIREAKEVFERMPQPDAVTCTVMVSLYSQFGLVDEAKALFDKSSEQSSISWNSMVMAYGRSGRIDEAKEMFDGMPRELKGMASSWNVMISAYAHNSRFKEAKEVYDTMPLRNEASDKALLLGYINKGLLDEARSLFDGFTEKSVVIWNTMLGAYSQCGDVEKAGKLFEEMPDPTSVSWDMLVSAHANMGDPRQALHLFRFMDLQGVRPTPATCAGILDACSSSSLSTSSSSASSIKLGLQIGRLVHENLQSCGLDSGTTVRNALISMYGKCGSVEEAKMVFDDATSRHNIVSWNLLLSANALNGRNFDVLELFKLMNLEGGEVSQVTLLICLAACSHAGLLEDGLRCFTSINRDFGVELHSEHYKCVVDLLGRSGQLQAAEKVIEAMPIAADDGAWTSFLSACSSQGSLGQASSTGRKMLNINPENSSLYVLLSHTHATGAAESS